MMCGLCLCLPVVLVSVWLYSTSWVHPSRFLNLGLDLCTTYPPWLSSPTFLELLAAESGLSLLACVCLSFAADMGLFVSSHQSPLALAICYAAGDQLSVSYSPSVGTPA